MEIDTFHFYFWILLNEFPSANYSYFILMLDIGHLQVAFLSDRATKTRLRSVLCTAPDGTCLVLNSIVLALNDTAKVYDRKGPKTRYRKETERCLKKGRESISTIPSRLQRSFIAFEYLFKCKKNRKN